MIRLIQIIRIFSIKFQHCINQTKFLPTEHWNISESEEEHQEQKDNESEFTTDSEMSDADDK